tara:strand:- start:2217 stop:2426 length:210 start_codon:yes stop_codon:yes gene_type:complete
MMKRTLSFSPLRRVYKLSLLFRSALTRISNAFHILFFPHVREKKAEKKELKKKSKKRFFSFFRNSNPKP